MYSLLFLCNMLPRLSISTNDSLATVKWTLFFPPPFWNLISSELLCVFSLTFRWFTHTRTRTHTRVHRCEKFSLNVRTPSRRASGLGSAVLAAFAVRGAGHGAVTRRDGCGAGACSSRRCLSRLPNLPGPGPGPLPLRAQPLGSVGGRGSD